MRRAIFIVITALVTASAVTGQQPPPSAGAPGGVSPAPPAPGPPRDNQTPQTGSARIRGRVVSAEDGSGLKNVTMVVAGGGLREPRALPTDRNGDYEIDELPAGRFQLSASKGGFVGLSYGQRRPFEAGRPLDVADKQVLEHVDFALPRGGVIAVRVTDEGGEPMPGVRIRAERYRYSQGVQQLTTVSSGSVNPFGGGTDDLGELRLYGLPPGDYYVTAGAVQGPGVATDGFGSIGPAGSGRSYVRTFYPGTPTAALAQRVTVQIGREVNIAFPVSIARLARVTGLVRHADGTPSNPLIALGYSISGGGAGTRSVSAPGDGTFSIAGMPPGDYTIQVSPRPSDTVREYASVPVTVTGDDVNLTIATNKPGSLRGRIVFDPPPPANLRPGALQPMLSTWTPQPGGAAGQVRVNDDWTFEITNVMEERLVRLRTPSNGWFVKAVMHEGRDIIDMPIDFSSGRDVTGVELVVTQQQTKLTGTVTNAQDQPLRDYAVVVFPAARDRWTPQSRFIAPGRPDQQGRFEITGLPPGSYLAVAVDYLETGNERDVELLNRWKDTAVPLTLADGESKTIALKLATN